MPPRIKRRGINIEKVNPAKLTAIIKAKIPNVTKKSIILPVRN
jgi:hypothetical protein